jgi:hypothetical protein
MGRKQKRLDEEQEHKDRVNSCLTKQVFFSEDIARLCANSYSKTSPNNKTFRHYKCRFCSGYHLTSRPLPKIDNVSTLARTSVDV